MTLSDFLLHVFVLVDDEYHELVHTRLRSRGPKTTKLTDSDVLTIEIGGSIWGSTTMLGSSPTSPVTTKPSFPPWQEFTGPASSAKPPICTPSPVRFTNAWQIRYLLAKTSG
jgi:hypothetical protein